MNEFRIRIFMQVTMSTRKELIRVPPLLRPRLHPYKGMLLLEIATICIIPLVNAQVGSKVRVEVIAEVIRHRSCTLLGCNNRHVLPYQTRSAASATLRHTVQLRYSSN